MCVARGFFRGSLVQLASSGVIQKLSKNRKNKRKLRGKNIETIFNEKKSNICCNFPFKKYRNFPTKKR